MGRRFYFLYLLGVVCILTASCQKSENTVDFKAGDSVIIPKVDPVTHFTYDMDTDSGAQAPETNHAVLMLPEQYMHTGRPTRLVIYCHSGGGYVTSTSSEAEGLDFAQYFVASGYAVLDAGSYPHSFAQRLKIDLGRGMGSPISLKAMTEAYNIVMEEYNLCKDGCFVFSNSNGGLLASNLVNLTNIPILGQSGVAPLLSLEKNAWNVPSAKLNYGEFSRYQNRSNTIRLFGMKDALTQEELNVTPYEKDKVGNYDPYDYNMYQTKMPYRAPYLVFLCKQDGIIDYNLTQNFCNEMNRRGSNVQLSDVEEYGGHYVVSNPIVVGQFKYAESIVDLRLTVKLTGDFFASLNPDTKQ